MSPRTHASLAGAACGVIVLAWSAACGGSTDPGPPPPPPPPPNRAPETVGAISPLDIEAGESEALAVSGFFRDPDGDRLSYAARSSDDAVAAASIAGAELTVTGVAPGSATLTVTASDPGGLSASQTAGVTVRPANRAPVAADSLPGREVTEGEAVTFDLTPYFSDPDGDGLAYAAESADTTVATLSVAGDELTIAGVAPGSATFTVTASDPGGLSASQTAGVTVRPANRAPAAADSLPDQEVAAEGAVTLDLTPYFSDPDGDELAYAAESADTTVATVSVARAELTITGVAAGSAAFTVTASDPGGLSASQTAAIAVHAANRAPVVADSIADQEVTVAGTVTLHLADHFSDPDGEALTYLASTSDPAIAVGTVAGDELTITGVATGSATLTVIASDSSGLSVAQAFGVTVAGAAGFRFREDFDGARLLSNIWLLQDVQSRLADGIASIEVTTPGAIGLATALLSPAADFRALDVRTRLAFGTVENTAMAIILWSDEPGLELIAVEIGPGVFVDGDDTNYRLRTLDGVLGWTFQPGAHGVSEAVPDNPGVFVQLRARLEGRQLRAWVGDVELFEFRLDAAPQPRAMSLSVYPPDEAGTGSTGLFDWVEAVGSIEGDGDDTGGGEPDSGRSPPSEPPGG